VRRLRQLACALLTIALLAVPAALPASENVSELARTLRKSSSEKERLSAAVALDRLRDRRAMRPLLRALRDDSPLVRAVAATALGHLGDARAVPALRRALRDRNTTVRERAAASIAVIEDQGRPRAPVDDRPRTPRLRVPASEPPRQSGPVHVIVKSAADRSGDRLSSDQRSHRASAMRSLLLRELGREPAVSLQRTGASQAAYNIDASIMKFARRNQGPYVEVECEIRVAVSNAHGKMLSFVTGGAKVQVPRRGFASHHEAQLRLEALENAVKGVRQDLVSYLHQAGRRPD
jgi:hypothetical protein